MPLALVRALRRHLARLAARPPPTSTQTVITSLILLIHHGQLPTTQFLVVRVAVARLSAPKSTQRLSNALSARSGSHVLTICARTCGHTLTSVPSFAQCAAKPLHDSTTASVMRAFILARRSLFAAATSRTATPGAAADASLVLTLLVATSAAKQDVSASSLCSRKKPLSV